MTNSCLSYMNIRGFDLSNQNNTYERVLVTGLFLMLLNFRKDWLLNLFFKIYLIHYIFIKHREYVSSINRLRLI